MKNKPSLIRQYLTKTFFLSVLPSALIITLYYTLFHTPFTEKAKEQIKTLKEENRILKNQNDSILKTIYTQQEDVERIQEIISQLNEDKQVLNDNLDSVNKDIQKNQKAYEKANRHSNNYTSNDISRYFANLQ